jgi:aminopeptidase YwaD
MTRNLRLKNLFTVLLIGITLGAAATVAVTGWTAAVPPQSREAVGEIERHVRYLASEALAGRGVDTPGIKLARDYIAAEFAKYGLQPGGDGGGFLQSFEVAVGVQVKQPSGLRLAKEEALSLDEQWTPLGLSASGKVEAEMVFVGYGITAKEHGYDDYEGIDVKDKTVLVLRYEPPPKDSSSPFKKYPDYSVHSALRTKANNARDHGAAGMILVDLHNPNSQQLLSTRTSLWRGGRSLVAAQVKRAVIEKQLTSRGVSLTALKEKIDRSETPASMVLGVSATLEVNLAEVRERADNVVAVLPGGDSRRAAENIVIGAHYDHLGSGHFGAIDPSSAGTIHPGADDNASGTAVLLDLARRLAQSRSQPARTIVFVAFSAEELGLYGSRHFVQSFQSLSSTKAMLNLDMVGRLRGDRVTVFGARSGQGFSGIVSVAAAQLGLQLTESDDVGRSDHLSFYNRQIPVLHFFTGNHPDYHRASDTAEKLNYAGMEKVSDLVMASTLALADKRDDLQFVSLPSRPPRQQSGEATGLNTYLGSIPDYGTDAPGVQLAGVIAGSPAAQAGLRAGDVIIRLASAKVQTIEDLTAALGAKKPGDEVEIIVLRAGTEVSFKATLQARSPNSTSRIVQKSSQR